MLKTLRTALSSAGGAQVLLAVGAIAWGLGRLQSIAEERQAYLQQLEVATATHEEALRLVQAHLAEASAEVSHPSRQSPVEEEETPQS